MPSINRFDGSVNTRLAPHLIGATESTALYNVDIASGILRPEKGVVNTELAPKVVAQNGQYCFYSPGIGGWYCRATEASFAVINSVLYMTDGANKPKKLQGSTEYNITPLAPTSAPNFASTERISAPKLFIYPRAGSAPEPNFTPEFETWTFKCRKINGAGDISRPTIVTITPKTVPIRGFFLMPAAGENLATGEYIEIYWHYSKWFNPDSDSSYVLIGTITSVNKKFEFIDTTVVPGTTFPTYAGPVYTLDGDIEYCVTFYNTTDSSESPPSASSGTLNIRDGYTSVFNIPQPTDPQVDEIRLYRRGGALTEFTLLVKLAVGATTYEDHIDDADTLGTILPSTLGEPPSGLTNLIEAYGILFGSVGDKLYYSEQGYFYRWSAFNVINIHDTVTGLCPTNAGIFVFTKTTTKLLTGKIESDFQLVSIDDTVGCAEHHSIVYYANKVIWYTGSAVAVTDGLKVRNLSWDRLGDLTWEAVKGVVVSDVYYLLFSQYTILRFDFKSNTLDYLSENDVANLFTDGLTLYGYRPNIAPYPETKFFDSVNFKMPYTYWSPEYTDGSLILEKTYKNVKIAANIIEDPQDIFDDTTVIVFIDGDQVATEVLSKDGVNEIAIPYSKSRGYKIRFNISGRGEVYEISWEAESANV